MKCAKVLFAVWTLFVVVTLAPASAFAQTEVVCAADAIVQPGDTLSTLASRFYRNARAYSTILDATNARARVDRTYATIANPNIIVTGWKLCVPGPISTQVAGTSATTAASTAKPDPFPLVTSPSLDLATDDMHPLMIEYMRRQDYPGSDIVIEQVLQPGANYKRYIASYKSEGLKIFALLTVPMGQEPENGWPVVVFNHGYIPPAQYRTTERYVAYVDTFARNGYIVFRSDYRGHGSSEGEARSGHGAPDYTVDVLNAVTAIKNYPDADPNRIGMWGHSMGGSITLRSMVVTQDIKAGVIWAGVVASYPDLLERWRRHGAAASRHIPQHARRWRNDLLEEYGSPEDNPVFWSSISANAYLEDMSGPLQLHHGTADRSVPVEFSASLNEQIQQAGGTVEYYAYQGDNHNISNSFGLAMQRSVAFFDKYVKDYTAGHPLAP